MQRVMSVTDRNIGISFVIYDNRSHSPGNRNMHGGVELAPVGHYDLSLHL